MIKISVFVRRFTLLFGARLFGALLMFVSNLLIVRIWSNDVLGLISVLLAVNGVLAVFCSAGFPSIATVLSAKYQALGAGGHLLGFLKHSRQIRIVGAVLACPISLGYLYWGTPFGGLSVFSLAMLLSVSVFLTSTLTNHSAILVGFERQTAAALPEVLLRPTVFLLLLIIAAWLGWEVSSADLFGLFVVANICAVGFVSYLLAKSVIRLRPPPDRSDRKEWNKSAPPWVITTLVWDFFIEIQILMAAAMALPAADLAILHVCFRLRMLAGFGMRSLYSMLLPKLYALHAEGRNTAEMTRRIWFMGTVYGVVTLISVYVLGGSVLSVFGSTFADSFDVLLVICSVILVRGLFGPSSAYLVMIGRHWSSSLIMLFCLLGSLASMYVMIEQFGALGVAANYAVWSSISTVLLWLRWKQNGQQQ